jgi:hypothetical protein
MPPLSPLLYINILIGHQRRIFICLKVWWHEATLYYFFFSLSFHTHSFITFAEFRFRFFIAVRSCRGFPLHWGAEQRFELEAASQQPDALPTEPRRTLLSHTAPY